MSAGDGTHRCESGFQEITHSGRAALRLCVTILNTGELKKPLGGRGGDDASTTWRGDQPTHDRANFAADFRGDGVRLSESGAPVTSSNRNDG